MNPWRLDHGSGGTTPQWSLPSLPAIYINFAYSAADQKKMALDLGDDRLLHLSQKQLKYKCWLYHHSIFQYKKWGSEEKDDRLIHHFRWCQSSHLTDLLLLHTYDCSLTTGNEWRHSVRQHSLITRHGIFHG